MSEQDGKQASTLQRPTTNDPEAWNAYWKAQSQPWRKEPEIDADRQKYLAERRAIVPDIVQGIYPFKDIKLTRADVEWLLATHENGRGPVDWSDENQREREGLDLRGARFEEIDLSDLPLTCLRAGLTQSELTYLFKLHGFNPNDLINLKAFTTVLMHNGMKDMMRKSHRGRLFSSEIVKLQAIIEAAICSPSVLASTIYLKRSDLSGTHLEGAKLSGTHLEKAIVSKVHFEDADLSMAHLNGSDLRGAFFSTTTNLENAKLGDKEAGFVFLSDIHWGEVNLSVVDWGSMKEPGEEFKAKQRIDLIGEKKRRYIRLNEYIQAVRTNHQLANILQSQGLQEDSARFAYNAEKLRRFVFRLQGKYNQYLFSGFLNLLAGYGYRPGRSVIWYLVTIFGFALVYFAIGHLPFFPDAFVFSLTSFHGRGFFPGLGSENSLHNPLVIMAAFEAVVGLLIEISFIATFTQRFLGR